LGQWTFDGATSTGTRQVVIPSELAVSGDLTLNFAFPDAIPNQGGSQPLALFVTSLSVESMPSMHPGDRIDLRKLLTLPPFIRDGWSGKERTGVWSSGHKSSMLLPIAAGDADPVLVLEGYGFFPTPDYKQRVTVRGGPVVLAEWTLDGKAPAEPRSIVIPRRLVKDGEVALDFDFPDATSPAANHVSTDPRQLAFFLTAVGLQAPAEHP
jgi:hypothetical protein